MVIILVKKISVQNFSYLAAKISNQIPKEILHKAERKLWSFLIFSININININKFCKSLSHFGQNYDFHIYFR